MCTFTKNDGVLQSFRNIDVLWTSPIDDVAEGTLMLRNIVVLAVVVLGCDNAKPTSPSPSKTPAPKQRKTSPKQEKNNEVIKSKSTPKQVLFTIDDLPVAMRSLYDEDQKTQLAQSLCAVLKKHNIPTIGFINMKWAKPDADAYKIWRNCSVVTLGNHTWSHPHMRKVGLEAYLEDLVKGHNALQAEVPNQKTIYFRYPYLYEGHDPAHQRAVRQKLKSLQSRNIPVTIDSMDWYYARGHAKALKKHDLKAAKRFQQAWFWDLEESTARAEWQAGALFDEMPPQVLLLHANPLTAANLERYILWLKARGYRFVDAKTVLEHPAYQVQPMSTAARGISRWLRLRRHRSMTKAQSK